MLQSMRDGAQSKLIKFFFFGLLMMAGLGLVMMDIGGFFRNNISPNIAFDVNDQSYSMVELDRNFSNALRNQNLTFEQGVKLGLLNQFLDTEINTRLLNQEVYDQDLRISDALVAEDTHLMMDRLLTNFNDQNVSKKQIFYQYLNNLGMNQQQYILSKKREMGARLLLDSITQGLHAPSYLVSLEKAYEKQQRVAVTAVIQSKQSLEPSNDDLKSFYATNSETYRIPEKRKFIVTTLEYNKIRDDIQINDDLLKQEYEARRDSYTQKETRTIVQAYLADLETAQKVYDIAQNNNNLEKAVMETTGSKDAILPATSFSKEDLPEALAHIAFSAQQGIVQKPVETELGIYVMQVQSITPEQVKSFDSVKKDLKKDLQEAKASETLYKYANEIEDYVASGATLREVSEELHMPVSEYDWITQQGFSGDSKIINAAFQTYENETSFMIEQKNGNVAFVFVEGVQPSSIPDFDTVAPQVKKDWIKAQKNKLSYESAQKIVAELKEGKKPVSLKSHPPITRNDSTTNSGLDPIAIAALFQLNNIGEYTIIPQKDGQLIIGLKEVKTSTSPLNDEEKVSLNNQYLDDVLAQYFAALNSKNDVDVNREGIQKYFESRLQP